MKKTLASLSISFFFAASAFAVAPGHYYLAEHETISTQPYGSDICPMEVVVGENVENQSHAQIDFSNQTDNPYESKGGIFVPKGYVTRINPEAFDLGKDCARSPLFKTEDGDGHVHCSKTWVDKNDVVSFGTCTSLFSALTCIIGNDSLDRIWQEEYGTLTYEGETHGDYGAHFRCTYQTKN